MAASRSISPGRDIPASMRAMSSFPVIINIESGTPSLGIVAARTAEKRHSLRGGLRYPLLHGGLPAGTGDTDYRSAERQSVMSRQGLQSGQRLVHTHESCTRPGRSVHLALHHETAHSPAVQFADVVMAVVVAAPYRHEERGSIPGNTPTAVGHHAADGDILAAERASAYRGYLAYRILHHLHYSFLLPGPKPLPKIFSVQFSHRKTASTPPPPHPHARRQLPTGRRCAATRLARMPLK